MYLPITLSKRIFPGHFFRILSDRVQNIPVIIEYVTFKKEIKVKEKNILTYFDDYSKIFEKIK